MMENPEPPDRAKICNNCREFILLFLNHEPNERLEVKFNEAHRGHPTSIIDIKELDLTQYKRFEVKRLVEQ